MGLSLKEIGKRFGRDASTVGYWVRRHGLRAAHATKHAPRGGLSKSELVDLIEQGLSHAAMAERLAVSPATVKYWLARNELRTVQAVRREDGRRAKAAALATVEMSCSRHGRTEFWMEGRGS